MFVLELEAKLARDTSNLNFAVPFCLAIKLTNKVSSKLAVRVLLGKAVIEVACLKLQPLHSLTSKLVRIEIVKLKEPPTVSRLAKEIFKLTICPSYQEELSL